MWPDENRDPQFETEHPEGELAAFALNALDDAEFQAVFNHVIRCPHCQEVLLGFQETAARLTEAAPEAPLPEGLKGRVLARAIGGAEETYGAREAGGTSPSTLPPVDPRWSWKRIKRWAAPVSIGALSLLLAASIGFMVSQQREISNLASANEHMMQQREFATASASPQSSQVVSEVAAHTQTTQETSVPNNQPSILPQEVVQEAGDPNARIISPPAPQPISIASASSSINLTRGGDRTIASNAATSTVAAGEETEAVDHVKKEMSDVVEATVMSAQPETEKLPMTSPMGTEPEAKGVLMVDPSGRKGVLMVSGMPADTYQIWLVRDDKRMMVDRIVVNENDGSGVRQLELDESVFGFHEVALMADERHGPTKPTGEKFLTARIISGPPVPGFVWRGR